MVLSQSYYLSQTHGRDTWKLLGYRRASAGNWIGPYACCSQGRLLEYEDLLNQLISLENTFVLSALQLVAWLPVSWPMHLALHAVLCCVHAVLCCPMLCPCCVHAVLCCAHAVIPILCPCCAHAVILILCPCCAHAVPAGPPDLKLKGSVAYETASW